MATATLVVDVNKMSYEELKAHVVKMQAAAQRKENTLSLGDGFTAYVGDKGTLCVRGLGKWPVALYAEQWVRLLTKAAKIVEALKYFDGKLAKKPAKADSDVPAIQQ